MITRLHTPQAAAAWLQRSVSGALCTDSRKVSMDDGFIAWPGAATDGRAFVTQALEAGAAACLVEEAGVDAFDFVDSRIACYSGLKAAAGAIAAACFHQPSSKLQVFAVTGTNGKTSTSWWLAQALSRSGRRCGLVGTLGIGEPDAMVPNGLTTPDPVLLQEQLRSFVDQGFRACALEASSIGIAEHRLDATQVAVAIFTNLTHDHLDYHGSMQAYWEAKKSLFAFAGLRAAVVNIDDPKGADLALSLQSGHLDLWTVSIHQSARLTASNIVQGNNGLSFDVVYGAESYQVAVETAGQYNVSNLLCVVAAMCAAGVRLKDAAFACNGLRSVPGRLEMLSTANMPLVAVDYAHTPDALEKVLVSLRPVAASRGGNLWCVFGCGGNRDDSKRPVMGAVAQRHADHIVVTSDNPRDEKPDAIIEQIVSGLDKSREFHTEADRAAAIAWTLAAAEPVDVVLLAGKGHESYQEILGVKYPFSDLTVARHALRQRTGAAS